MAGCGASGDAQPGSRSGDPRQSTVVDPRFVPIFNDVTELNPARLPPGWQRCGGGPSTLKGAGPEWWSQTFGPTGDGKCRELVTVTQMPPDVDHYCDPDAEVITSGDYDALHWVDDDSGAEWLFLWAYRQNLVVEACCEPAATAELFNIAEASYEGLRIDELARCIGDESDLAREETLSQVFGAGSRMYTTSGCPLRLDIVAWGIAPADDHCFPGVRSLTDGSPVGASTKASPARHYYRDPDNLLGQPAVRRRLDLDAQHPRPPSTAVTGRATSNYGGPCR
jgi:hypothetical protein